MDGDDVRWEEPAPGMHATISVVKREGNTAAGVRVLDVVDVHARACTAFGRTAGQAEVVLDHPSISRRHACVGWTDGGRSLMVQDCASTHGTRVNGQALPKGGNALLRDGDVIMFGASSREYIVSFQSPPSERGTDMPPPPPRALARQSTGMHDDAGPAAGSQTSLDTSNDMPPPPPRSVAGIARQHTGMHDEDADAHTHTHAQPSQYTDGADSMPPPPRRPGIGLAHQLTGTADAASAQSLEQAAPRPSEHTHTHTHTHKQADDSASDARARDRAAERAARDAEIAAIRASFAQAPVFSAARAAPPADDAGDEAREAGHDRGDDAENGAEGTGEDDFEAMAAAAGLPVSFGGGARARNMERLAAARAGVAGRPDGRQLTGSGAASAGSKRDRRDVEDDAPDAAADSRSADDVAAELGLPVSHEAVLAGHTKAVSALAMEPSGARVLTGSLDYTLRLYDFGGMDASHKPFRELTPHSGQPIFSVAYSPLGDRFIVGTGDARAKVYDREGAQLMQFIKGDVYITDMVNTKGHVAGVTAVRWHPTQHDVVITGSGDGSARFWNLKGRMVFDELLCGDVIKFKSARGVKAGVCSLAVAQDGAFLVAGCDDGSVQLVNVRGSGHRYVRPDSLVRDAHTTGEVTCVAISPDGRYIASRGAGDEAVRVWDIRKFTSGVAVGAAPAAGAHPACVANFIDIPTFHSYANVGWSPDGRFLIAGTDIKRGSDASGHLHVYEVSRHADEAREGTKPAAAVYSVAVAAGASAAVALWHPRIQQIVVGCGDGASRVLYRPGVSVKGALMSSARAPKRRELVDSVPLGRIINPDALPMYREDVAGMRSRKRGAPATATALTGPTKLPDSEPAFVHQGVRSFTQVFMEQNPASINLRTQDPTAVLRDYADRAANTTEGAALRRVYAQSQPKAVLADRTIEDEEEKARSEMEELLRGNIAGK